MKILTIFGTRPEAIKLAPVVHAFTHHPSFDVKVCVTAQHRSMLDQVLSLYKITPDYDLDIMKDNQTLSGVTQMIMRGLDAIFAEFNADWVFVQGDTNTTLSASLSAFYHKIPVAHIEAGLRTYNIHSPWPEEINRQLTSRLAALHFPPTEEAQQNLLKEGICQSKITVTGNTVIDALLATVKQIQSNAVLEREMTNQFDFLQSSKKIILVTSHRRENFGNGLHQVCQALLDLSMRDDVSIVFPVHLNPNISEPVNHLLKNKKNIYLLMPQEYLPFVYLMMKSYLIVTDSGGIQEEAPSLGKPVLVVRHTTERPEGIKAGTAKLIGVEKDQIIQEIETLLDNTRLYNTMSTAVNPYGDGKAAERIVERLQHECQL